MLNPAAIFRYVLMTAVFLICISSGGLLTAQAGEITLEWEAPSQFVHGYRIYYALYGEDLRDGNKKEVMGRYQTSCTITGLESGKHYVFAATSFHATRESEFSEKVEYWVPEGDYKSSGSGSWCFIQAAAN